MKYFELEEDLKKLILDVTSKTHLLADQDFIAINQEQYNLIFWKLFNSNIRNEFGKQISASEATKLVHQLNLYLTAHKNDSPRPVKLKNPVLISRPKPPLREQYCAWLPILDQFDQKFVKDPDVSLISLVQGECSQSDLHMQTCLRLGQLIYSAMRYGGLLRVELLKSFFVLLLSNSLNSNKHLCWFELTGELEELHVWIPDPITLTLLPRFFSFNKEHNLFERQTEWKLSWFKCLTTYLKKCAGDKLHKLGIKSLINIVLARLSLTQTACHLPVLSGTEPNLTLQKNSFYRLLNLGNVTNQSEENIQETSNVIPAVATKSAFKTPRTDQTDCYAVLKIAKNKLNALTAKQNLSNDTNLPHKSALVSVKDDLELLALETNYNLLPVTRLLILWAATRLTSQNKWSGKLKPQTLLSYLGSIFWPMSRLIGARHVDQLDTPALDELYLEIIDEVPNIRSRAKRAKILRDFHLFLERDFNLKPSYVCSTMVMQSAQKVTMMVDANILLPSEYQRVWQFLNQPVHDDQERAKREAQAILLLLGFRCGLRRSEAHYLTLSDIQTPGNTVLCVSALTELLIRPHYERKLKSTAAERRIPLGMFLSGEEKDVFNRYLAKFQNQHAYYLFSQPGDSAVIDEDQLFTPLLAIIQQVTKDPSFRYHRLRHSFVTWLFWCWQQHKYPNLHPLQSYLHHEVMDHLAEARVRYFNGQQKSAIRSELHAISMMTGHSGPSITILHYLHSMQWTCCAEFWRDFSLHQDAAAKLLCLPRRTYFDQLKKKGFLATVLEQILPYCTIPSEQAQDVIAIKELEAKIRGREEMLLYQHLYEYNQAYLLPRKNKETLRAPPEAFEWALQYRLNAQRFDIAVQLLNRLQEHKTPAPRGAVINRDTQENQDRVYFQLPAWPKHSFAETTIELILNIFKSLSSANQKKVMSACKTTVENRTKDWTDFRFWQPRLLWSYIENILPLLTEMQADYALNLTIKADRTDTDPAWTALLLKWTPPEHLNHIVQPTSKYVSDTGKRGYASLVLMHKTDAQLQRYVGDHGFFIALTVIYFYYGSNNIR